MKGKRPNSSFSLLNLLLIVALFAVGIALHLSNQKVQTANQQYDELLQTTDHMIINDATLFNYRRLPQPAPLVFQYQIAVPRDTTMELKVMGGSQTDGAPLCRMDLQGPKDGFSTPEQYKITVYVQNTANGYRVGCESSAGGATSAFAANGPLEWLDDLSETNSLMNPPPSFRSPVQSSDPTETIGLHYQSENSATMAGLVQNKKNPNYLLISVGPKTN